AFSRPPGPSCAACSSNCSLWRYSSSSLLNSVSSSMSRTETIRSHLKPCRYHDGVKNREGIILRELTTHNFCSLRHFDGLGSRPGDNRICPASRHGLWPQQWLDAETYD